LIGYSLYQRIKGWVVKAYVTESYQIIDLELKHNLFREY